MRELVVEVCCLAGSVSSRLLLRIGQDTLCELISEHLVVSFFSGVGPGLSRRFQRPIFRQT